MKIMISACLMGENCKYDGKNNLNEKALGLAAGNEIIAVCPELMGGLKAPRHPCEIVNGRVFGRDGTDVDAEFRRGARKCLELALREQPDLVVMQPRSPSCGAGRIYDGSFSGRLIDGNGVTAQLLIDNGFKVVTIDNA